MGSLWLMIQGRFVWVGMFVIIIVLSTFIGIATWKSRVYIPKSLTATMLLMSILFIACALVAIIFLLIFGYNS